MALTFLDAAPIFGPETAALQDRLQATRATGRLAVPQLVGINLHPDYRPIRWYESGLGAKAAEIDLGHEQRSTDDRLFYSVDCQNENEARRVIESLAGRDGVGILAFRPFQDESQAAQRRVLSAIPDAQNVDGQVEDKELFPQTMHIPATVVSCLRLLEHARAEYGGLFGLGAVAVIGDGPAVGRRAKIELASFADVVNITLDENQEWMENLGYFDAVIAAAGGGPRAAEIITPKQLARKPRDRRPPLVVIDAAYESLPGEKRPQGNLVRNFRDPEFQQQTNLVAIVALLGAVSKGAQTEIFRNTFGVADAQRGNYNPLVFASRP